MTAGARVLLVSPAFHGYHRAIADELGHLGHDVVTHVYDANLTVLDKVRTKVRFELPELTGHDRTAARARFASDTAREVLRLHRPDVVLVIKGDVLDATFWETTEALGSRTVLWLYDELRRTRWDRALLARLDAVASYSSEDVASLQGAGVAAATHVPLGFDTTLKLPPLGPAPEVSFIGARYPAREALLLALMARRVPVRAYGRDWSHDLRDRARTWGSSRPAVPAGRDLDRAKAYAVMRSSSAALNVHGDQDGFTMRTFEASGVGGLQLCDRQDVSHYLDPGSEVLVFDSPDGAAEHYARAVSDPGWADGIRAAGRRRVLAEHTLAHRARQLEALWG